MSKDIAIPVDMKTKRLAAGHRQGHLGEILGVTNFRISEYESGRFNIPTPQACEVALLYGGLTLEYKGIKFELRPKVDGDSKPTEGIAPVEGALIAGKEMRDFLEHTQKLAEYTLAIMRGRCHGTQYLADAVKEAKEAKEAAERFILGVKESNPEAYKRGISLAQHAREAAVQAS